MSHFIEFTEASTGNQIVVNASTIHKVTQQPGQTNATLHVWTITAQTAMVVAHSYADVKQMIGLGQPTKAVK